MSSNLSHTHTHTLRCEYSHPPPCSFLLFLLFLLWIFWCLLCCGSMHWLSSPLDSTHICCRSRPVAGLPGKHAFTHTHTHTGTQKLLTGNYIVIYWQDRILLKEPWPPENQYDSQIDLWGRDLIWFIDILTLRNYLFVQCIQVYTYMLKWLKLTAYLRVTNIFNIQCISV